MDALDRIAAPGLDLVARVDQALLVGGAPAGHAIWPLLRRVGVLPGDAVAAIAALAPEPLRRSADELRVRAGECARLGAAVGGPDHWTGAAAEAYALRWRDLSGHLCGAADGAGSPTPDEESVAGRLAATAAYLADVADWAAAARRTLAGALARVLGSAEAVRLRSARMAECGAAAATVGARLLEVSAAACDGGDALRGRWAGRLEELPYRPAAAGAPGPGGTTSVIL